MSAEEKTRLPDPEECCFRNSQRSPKSLYSEITHRGSPCVHMASTCAKLGSLSSNDFLTDETNASLQQ